MPRGPAITSMMRASFRPLAHAGLRAAAPSAACLVPRPPSCGGRALSGTSSALHARGSTPSSSFHSERSVAAAATAGGAGAPPAAPESPLLQKALQFLHFSETNDFQSFQQVVSEDVCWR